jgi:hypothetical protein
MTATLSLASEIEEATVPTNIHPDEHTYYVDAQLSDSVAGRSAYTFNSLKEALTLANGKQEVTMWVAPGVYWLDDPDDPTVRRGPNGEQGTGIPYAMEVNCPGLQIIGLDDDPRNTVMAVNRGQTQGALGNYTMLQLRGDDLTFENLTLGNFCNVDLDYPLRPELSRPKRGEAIVQAQVAICEGSDRVLARRCRFISRLNLCPLVGARRTVFDDCYFECTDDALAGSAVYLNCRFTFFSSKPFYNTSPTGAVFLHCHIDTHTRGTQYLTKVPGAVTMIDTDIRTLYDASASPLAINWSREASSPVCYQHGVTLNGSTYLVGASSKQMGVTLLNSDPLLSAFRIVYEGDTIYNVANLVAGDDDWDPLKQRARIADVEAQLGSDLLHLPVAMFVDASRRGLAAVGDTLSLRARPVRWCGYEVSSTFSGSTLLRWSAPGQLAIQPTAYATARCTSRNNFDRKLHSIITVTSDYGCQGATIVEVEPYLTAAPTFTTSPNIAFNKKAKRCEVHYELSGTGEDISTITWYRCPTEACAEALLSAPATAHDAVPEAIAVRRANGSNGATYTPNRADVDQWLVAVVTPRRRGTETGSATAARSNQLTGKQLKWAIFDEQKLSTDFHDLPTEWQPLVKPGCWTLDAYKPLDTEAYPWTPDPHHAWYYGAATDAAVGVGLVQQSRGARLFYTPTRTSCRSMRVTAIVDPCKSGGQGFGSATGQYLEVYIAYDAHTLTGYGLRIERTAQYDKAVVFTLMRYDHGVATPLTQPQASSCFRSSCTLKLALSGHTLRATASTTAEAADPREGVSPEVDLEATVEGAAGCSLGLQHTGSTGASATMIHYLEAEWGN